MNPSDYIRASNGDGEAVRAFIVEERGIGNMDIITDSVLNFPQKFIATTGTLDESTGLLDESTMTIMKCHLDGSIIVIEEFAPGYTDQGNTVDQVVLLKPTTEWANAVGDALDNAVPITRTVNGHALSSDVTVTKGDVGLGNVDNTSDASKPVSTATQTALDAKYDKAGGPITGDVTVTGDIYSNGEKVLTSYDTGWVKLGLTGMADYSTDDGPRVRRIGNTVEISGQMHPTTTATSQYFATLPEWAAPSVAALSGGRIVFVCQGSGNERWALSVKSDRTLLFERYSGTVTTGIWLPMSVSFFAD